MASAPVLDPLAQQRREVRVWTDPGRLEHWRAPKPRGRLPRWVLVLVAVVVLGGVLAAVGVAGGFADRRDRVTRVPSDAVIETGPWRLTFDHAVASTGTGYDDETSEEIEVWEISVHGTIQVTGDESPLISTGDSGFMVANLPSNEEALRLDGYEIGERYGDASLAGSGQVTPGLPPVPVVWRFDSPAENGSPTEVVRLAVWEQQYSDNTITKTGELSWNRLPNRYEILVPLTVVPV